MNILYDHQIFVLQKYGGISRCFCELAMRIKKVYGENVKVVVFGNQNYYAKQKLGYGIWNLENLGFKDEAINLFLRINQMCIKQKCKKGKVDILHSTWYDEYLLDIDNCRQIITINDMIQEKFSVKVRQSQTILLKKKLMEKADKIIAISENTKNDIIELYPHINREKIVVAYPGGNISKYPKRCGIKLPRKYILYVGTRMEYKNFTNFAKATQIIMDKHADVSVVCVGGGDLSSKELRMFGNCKDRVYQYNVNDSELAYIYSRAVEFVFPSLYEGFGIPIVEAMSCGCPVVLSKASCFPEIADDAAIYFDPNNIKDMAEKIELCLIDENLRNVYSQKGKHRAKKFSWNKYAAKIHAVYEEVLKEE